MAYLLKKNNDKKELFSTPKDFSGYTFKPKTNKKYLSVKEVTVVDPEIIDKILTKKFSNKFEELIILASKIINDDDSTNADTSLVLDEVAKVRGILLNRYQKFLSKEKEELFLQKLRLIENQLRLKQVILNQQNMLEEYQKINSQSRGSR